MPQTVLLHSIKSSRSTEKKKKKNDSAALTTTTIQARENPNCSLYETFTVWNVETQKLPSDGVLKDERPSAAVRRKRRKIHSRSYVHKSKKVCGAHAGKTLIHRFPHFV